MTHHDLQGSFLKGLDFTPDAWRSRGSMGPKVAAACRFVNETGGHAVIGSLRDAAEVNCASAGTQLRPD